MKNRKSILFVLGIVLVLMVAATAADAPKLIFKFTRVNVPGEPQTFPGGVNNSGVMVGSYTDTSGEFHGFMLKGKELTTIDDPNGSSTSCRGINPNGTIAIVGDYFTTSGDISGFLYKNGTFTDIRGPGGSISASASAIDDKGNIVGWYQDSSTLIHGFLLKGSAYTTLDVPGATETEASGINNHGSIVLFWYSTGDTESSLYNGKTYKTINVPGAVASQAQGLNQAGDVVYTWFDSSNIGHGALRHAGKYYKFRFPKSVYTFARGINDHQLIVGGYETKKKGPFSGFKATYK